MKPREFAVNDWETAFWWSFSLFTQKMPFLNGQSELHLYCMINMLIILFFVMFSLSCATDKIHSGTILMIEEN